MKHCQICNHEYEHATTKFCENCGAPTDIFSLEESVNLESNYRNFIDYILELKLDNLGYNSKKTVLAQKKYKINYQLKNETIKTLQSLRNSHLVSEKYWIDFGWINHKNNLLENQDAKISFFVSNNLDKNIKFNLEWDIENHFLNNSIRSANANTLLLKNEAKIFDFIINFKNAGTKILNNIIIKIKCDEFQDVTYKTISPINIEVDSDNKTIINNISSTNNISVDKYSAVSIDSVGKTELQSTNDSESIIDIKDLDIQTINVEPALNREHVYKLAAKKGLIKEDKLSVDDIGSNDKQPVNHASSLLGIVIFIVIGFLVYLFLTPKEDKLLDTDKIEQPLAKKEPVIQEELTTPDTTLQEELDWERAKIRNQLWSYNLYLSQWPDGKYKQEAQSRIEQLKRLNQ